MEFRCLTTTEYKPLFTDMVKHGLYDGTGISTRPRLSVTALIVSLTINWDKDYGCTKAMHPIAIPVSAGRFDAIATFTTIPSHFTVEMCTLM